MSKSRIATKLEKKLKKPKSVSDLAEQIKTEFLTILREQGEFLEKYDIGNDEIQPLVSDAQEKLNESIEKSQAPLRVSMIGLFSSGKTVTLCSLLNKPRILSSSVTPTTGNVVEMQIVPPGQGQDSKQMKCILFSQMELEAMLRDYYTWLASKEKVRLSDLPEQSGFLRGNINNLISEVRENLREKWMQEAKKPSDFRSLKRLAHLYFILATIERYVLKYQEENSDMKKSYMLSMPYDPENEEAQKRLKSVTILAMEWDLNMLHPDELDKLADKFWQHTPDTFRQLYEACENGNIRTEVLRALLPLYKRIILTEEMDLPGGWGETDRIAFLDFPGLDSGSRRDVYLCLRELDAAHTNMLFFLANRPNVSQAQDLTEIIAEARTHTASLSDRIIPVINFFDAYPHDFEDIAPDDADAENPENALKRAEEFFAKEEVAGAERGFDIFERILGNLQLTGDWTYHLLTPVAGMDSEKLSASEKKFRRDYEEKLGNYGQLLKDIKTAKRELRKDKAKNKAKIAKYDRLQYALEAYIRDGGVGYLREALGDVLKSKGARLIAEDARVPLILIMERFEQEIISRLEHEDIEIDDDDAIEDLEREQVKRNITALWRQMEMLTLEWTRQGEQVMPEHKKDESSYDKPVYISPLDLCESKVLERVLADKFWDALDKITSPDDVPLSELAGGYRDMVKELDEWGDRALQDTIQHTLEKLDHTEILLETDEKVSFHGLCAELSEKYVNKAKLNDQDKKTLEYLFSLSSEKETLYNRLQERRREEEEQQRIIAQSSDNAKVPFNENLTFSWSPFEVMKIQRQIIITLQRHITSRFAFYISVFFNEFCQVIKERLDDPETSVNSYFKKYNNPGDLFDQLAEIPIQDKQEEDDISLFERRKKAKEVATKIISVWETLVD